MKFAETVYSSGNDLLQLINGILDLSKVEAGKMPIAPRIFPLDEVREYLERTFRHIAEQKGLAFTVRMTQRLPATMFGIRRVCSRSSRTCCRTRSSSRPRAG